MSRKKKTERELTKVDMKLSKKAFLDAYTKAFGNITTSCHAVNISRQCFYNWKTNDAAFALELENIAPQERFLDFIESKLVQKINEGDTTALIFVAKCKAKSRGYVEKQELEHSGEIKITVEEKRIS